MCSYLSLRCHKAQPVLRVKEDADCSLTINVQYFGHLYGI